MRWISLSAASGVVGCGGGGDASGMAGSESGPGLGPGPGPDPIVIDPTEPKAAFSKAGKGLPGTAVSPAQRAAALDALNAKLNQLYDSTRGIASPAGALAWLEQQDAYQTIGFSATGNVYAVFDARVGADDQRAPDSGGTVTVEWSGSGLVGPFMLGASDVAVTGRVTPQSRNGAFLATIFGTGIQEKTTVSIPGFAPQLTIRSIGFEIDSQVDTNSVTTIVVPFSVGYTATTVTQSHTVAGARPYNNADLATRIELGPFTAKYPPQERLGGR